jgi:hypothetical protein
VQRHLWGNGSWERRTVSDSIARPWSFHVLVLCWSCLWPALARCLGGPCARVAFGGSVFLVVASGRGMAGSAVAPVLVYRMPATQNHCWLLVCMPMRRVEGCDGKGGGVSRGHAKDSGGSDKEGVPILHSLPPCCVAESIHIPDTPHHAFLHFLRSIDF